MKFKKTKHRLSFVNDNSLFERCFGLPFLIAALCVLYKVLFSSEINGKEATGLVRLLTFIFSIPFACIGLFLFFGFKQIIVDKKRKKITTIWGVLFPIKKTVQALPEANFIQHDSEVRTNRSENSHSRSYTMYMLSLTKGEESTEIFECQDILKTRRISEYLSSFLELPIKDTSLGSELTSQPDELDLSLKEMLSKNFETVERPQIPKNLINRVSEGYDDNYQPSTIIKFRSLAKREPGLFKFLIVVFTLASSILSYRVYSFTSNYSGEHYISDLGKDSFTFIVFVCLVALIGSSVHLLKSLIQLKVSISSNQLVMKTSLIVPLKSTKIDLDQIENLILKKGYKDIYADLTTIGDKACVRLLKAFAIEEVKYLDQLIKHKVQKA